MVLFGMLSKNIIIARVYTTTFKRIVLPFQARATIQKIENIQLINNHN
jgi:hypothetical protein